MEKVLSGTWYNSRTLGIKLPERKPVAYRKFGNEDAWTFSTSWQPAGSGVDSQSNGRVSKSRNTPTAAAARRKATATAAQILNAR